MSKSVITYTIMYVVLVIVQALLLNHIALFNCAMCFLFIYFLIKLPLDLHLNWLLTLGFLLGLSVDILSDTLGLNALSCTILAVFKRPVFFAYVQHDDHVRGISPGIGTMGWLNFTKYLLTMSAIYSLVVITLEYLTVDDPIGILIKVASSTVFTFLLILAIDSLFYKQQT